MKNADTHFGTSLLIAGTFFFALLLAFSWGSSLMKDAKIDLQIRRFEAENTKISLENKELLHDLRYLESPQYRDKWAKENKGLAQPGEKVLIVEEHIIQKDIFSNIENKALLKKQIMLSKPNREQWKIFFFGEN